MENNVLKMPPEMMKKFSKDRHVKALRQVMDYLYDGEPKTIGPLHWIHVNYKDWQKMFIWLVKNEIKGKKLMEFFQNESPDGGGFHMGVEYIASKMDGMKYNIRGIKVDELSKGGLNK